MSIVDDDIVSNPSNNESLAEVLQGRVSRRSVLGASVGCGRSAVRPGWATYLACEENFDGYFRKTAARNAVEACYGIGAAGFGYLWHTTNERFQVATVPNEPNRFGWVTEIDPIRPTSMPAKRGQVQGRRHGGVAAADHCEPGPLRGSPLRPTSSSTLAPRPTLWAPPRWTGPSGSTCAMPSSKCS